MCSLTQNKFIYGNMQQLFYMSYISGCIDNADYIGACHVDVLKPSLCKPSIWLSDLTKGRENLNFVC